MDIAPLLDIPEVKPAIEQIRGRWHQKVSPQRRHSLAQFRMSAALTRWAGERGEVGPEWRCYLFDDDAEPTSLVADVSYFSFERLPKSLGKGREQPTIAPDIAVEIFSPSDARKRLREKISLYFAFGSRAIIVIDSRTRDVRRSRRYVDIANLCGRRPSTFCSLPRSLHRSHRTLPRSRLNLKRSTRLRARDRRGRTQMPCPPTCGCRSRKWPISSPATGRSFPARERGSPTHAVVLFSMRFRRSG